MADTVNEEPDGGTLGRILASVDLKPSVGLKPNDFSEEEFRAFSGAISDARQDMVIREAYAGIMSNKQKHDRLAKVKKAALALHDALDLERGDGFPLTLYIAQSSDAPDLNVKAFVRNIGMFRQAVCSATELAEKEIDDPDNEKLLIHERGLAVLITEKLPKIYDDFIEQRLTQPFKTSVDDENNSASHGIRFISACLLEFGITLTFEAIKRRFYPRS